MSGQMELELELGLRGRSTNAYMTFSEILLNNSNARESGGTQSVFPKRKVHAARPSTRYRAITRVRESHWSTIASSETGNGLMLRLHASLLLCRHGSVEAGLR